MQYLNNQKYKTAFTILELMLVIVISTSSLLLMTRLYLYLSSKQIYWRQKLELQEQVQQLIFKISKDIRRSGMSIYKDNNNLELFSNNPYLFYISNQSSEIKNSCILFSYDLNLDGCLGNLKTKNQSCIVNQQNNTTEIAKELFGYRLHNNNVETRNLTNNQVNNYCIKEECNNYLSKIGCEQGRWYAMLDQQKFKVNQLEFNWQVATNILQIKIKASTNQLNKVSYQSEALINLLKTEEN